MTDPDERQNLAEDEAQTDRIEELHGMLDDWFARYVDPAGWSDPRWDVAGSKKVPALYTSRWISDVVWIDSNYCRERVMGERLKDKVAIVTGAGSIGPGWGNGKATAVLFAREGAKVFAVDINPAAAEETKAIINAEGGRCAISATDVSKASDVKAMVEICLETYGRIDILHNNVGIVEVGGCVEASEESWNHVNDVNLKSVFLTCKFVLPHMEDAGRRHNC